MDQVASVFQQPFVWGLLLGLLFAFFTWKSAFAAKRTLRKESLRLEAEQKELQSHLNTQLKVNGEGNKVLEKKLEELREQNENLRVNLATLQNKPGRAEIRQLHIMENAVGLMREQAPGFAQAWEKAYQQAEAEHAEAEGGLKKLVQKVMPRLNTTTAETTETAEEA